MKISVVLKDLATLYRRYGDIDLVIETPHRIYAIQRVDEDIWNVDSNVTAVIETEQVDNPHPEIPARKKTRPTRSRSSRSSVDK